MTTTGTATRGNASTAAELGARIDAIRRTPEAARTLAGMLDERSPHFAERGTTYVERLRGYILASFETTGLPAEGVPYVLEELETGWNPYTVAAAARALRGASEIPADAPRLLVAALARLQGADDVVSFERLEPAPVSGSAVTALTELADTLSFLGPRAHSALEDLELLLASVGESFSPAVRAGLGQAVRAISRADSPAAACCCAPTEAEASPRVADPGLAIHERLGSLALEDQDGTQLSFAEAFFGRPSALAFFYTRCTNPDKCSLTVTRLARLAQRTVQDGLDANVAGVSYDPGFDRPARLKTFGADRGLNFSRRCRLLRTVGSFEPLRQVFDLGVGFGPVTVNRHRLDLVVLDSALRVTERFERRLWDEESVLYALRGAARR